MPIKLNGGKPASNPATDPVDLSGLGSEAPPSDEGQSEAPASGQASKPTPQPQQPAPGHQTPASFLVTGTAQKTQVDQVKATQTLRQKLRTGAREFFLQPGEFAKLVFLDGTLLHDGVFDTPMAAVHMLQIGGQWHKFICNKHTEGQCIVCDSNADGSQPTSLQLFTVINVMPYTIKGGPNKGTILPARLQLFPATLKVRERLVKRAKSHANTLAGSLYQFSREDKQSARTGDDIEFIQEVPLDSVLQKFPKLGSRQNAKGEWEEAPTTVLNYAEVYPVVTNAEIAQLRPDLASMAGFVGGGVAGQSQPSFGADPTGEIDDELPF